ncbi:hypothetical protein BGX38DRAFT_332303 [Terfezia claveryi]|nr:hypothetical protein BGX38DRAFT_332303 [Terfezia claveryi]
MLTSKARSSSALAVRRAYLEPSRRAVYPSTRVLQSPTSIPLVHHSSRPQRLHPCTVLILRSQSFSTTPTHNSTRRSRRVHREALERVNATLTGRIPAFTGSPPTASPAALRLAAKARLERNRATEPPPEFLDYEPQRNKPSSVFFWSDAANEMDRRLMARGNYPPPLPKFKHDENQQISKCHPSVWLASAHHLQMMHEGYDRLAFMGDAVAGKSISDLLLNDYYCIAGCMALLKARLVSNAQFAYFSRIYNIPCKNNENAQGDAFEALVGALYLDGKRDSADVDKIIYNWLKELIEPWLELYIGQLSPAYQDRVVSLHRAVPIAIAVATSNNPNSSQVMMAWESNIATQMIERRLKRGQDDRNLLQAAVAQAALQGPTVDAIGTCYESPEFLEPAEEGEPMEEGVELMEEEEPAEEEVEDLVEEEEAVDNMKKQQDTAAATGKAWPTAKTTPSDSFTEKRKAAETLRRAEKERIRTETEALRKANEERRQREMERRKEAEEKEAARVTAEQKRLEELARQREEQRRLEVLRLEEKLRKELVDARRAAEEAKQKADKEAEIARKKLEENRPITKAERRADKKAAQLEVEMAKLEARKRQLGVVNKETEEANVRKSSWKLKMEEWEAKEEAKKEQAEKEQAEKEQAEKEQAEKEQAEKEQAEKEQAEKEKAEKEKAEKEKAEKEEAEKEKAEKEEAEKEKAEKEKAEEEKVEKGKAEKRKVEMGKVEKEKVEKEKAEKGKAEKWKAEKRKTDKEKSENETEKVAAKAIYTPPPWIKPTALPTPAAPTPRPSPTPPPLKPSPAKIEALIAEKEAARAARLVAEEEALKFQRLLYDIQEMEDLVTRRREQTFKNSPYMTDGQKKEFAKGWAQYALMQREKMEKDAGVDVGSTLAHVKPEPADEKKKEEKESTGFFGKLFGAFRGKK